MLRLVHGVLPRRSTLHRYSHFCKQGRLLLTKRRLFVNSVPQGLEVGFDGGVQAPGLGLLLAQLGHQPVHLLLERLGVLLCGKICKDLSVPPP
jgi:hypothetical protein